jgi:hypothetical protein
VLTEEKLALSSFKGSVHGNSFPQDYPATLEMIRCLCVMIYIQICMYVYLVCVV